MTTLESQLLDFSKRFSENRREMYKTLADAGVTISELQVKLDDIKRETDACLASAQGIRHLPPKPSSIESIDSCMQALDR